MRPPGMRAAARSVSARVAIAAICVALAGCGVAARQTIQTVRGGYSDLLLIQPVESLSAYRGADVRPLTSDVGALVPPALLSRLHAAVTAALAARGTAPPPARTLRIQSRVIHAELKPRALHKEVILRVTLLDGADGRVLGIANVVGQAGGVSDESDLANGVAKGMVQLLAEHGFPAGR